MFQLSVQDIHPGEKAGDKEEAIRQVAAALDKTAVLTPELFFKAAAQLSAMNADYIDDSYVAIRVIL